MYSISVSRYFQYYIYTAIIPDMFATSICVLGLWIPEVNSRLGLSVTALLTVIAVMWTITQTLPVSNDKTWMQRFSNFCIIIIGLCCFENTVVSYASTKQGVPPKWLKHFIRFSNIFSTLYKRFLLYAVDNCCDWFCDVSHYLTISLSHYLTISKY